MYKQKYQKQTSRKKQETEKGRARQQGKVTTWKIWKYEIIEKIMFWALLLSKSKKKERIIVQKIEF